MRRLHSTPHARRSLSLVEIVISTAITSLMLVAALEAVGSARTGMKRIGDRAVCTLLAEDLMVEVLEQDYADPHYGPGSIGVGGDESGTGDRSLYDDVDDYDGWRSTPPEQKDGAPLDWANDFERRVHVVWVDADDFASVAGSETGVKRITVTVLRNDVALAELTALRTAGVDMLVDEGDAPEWTDWADWSDWITPYTRQLGGIKEVTPTPIDITPKSIDANDIIPKTRTP